MMTFQEMRTKNPNLYPNQIEELDREMINNWFDFRQVCDDDKFEVFFRRQLNLYYSKYLEMQRIEPGYAHYDWLVNQYLEVQRKNTGSSENSANSTNNATNNLTITNNLTNKTENSGSDSNQQNITNHVSNTTTSESSNTLTNSGKDTGSNSGTNSSNLTTTNNLEDKNSTIITNKNNQTQTNSSTSSDKNKTTVVGSELNDMRNVSKNLPLTSSNIGHQDFNLGNQEETIVTVNQIVNLDFTEGTTQAEASSTTGSLSNQNSLNTGNSLSTISYTGEPDKNETNATYTKTGTVTNSGSDTSSSTNEINYGKVENSEGNNSTDFTEDSTNSLSNTINYGKIETATNTGTVGNSGNSSNTSEEKSTSKNENLEQMQQTGRSGNIAEILAESYEFIKGSPAFLWLKSKLEEVFLGVYDI